MYRFALSKLVPQAFGYSWATDKTAKEMLDSITNWPNNISIPTEAQLEAKFQEIQTEQLAIKDTQAETINALTARIVALESKGTV